MKNTVVAVIVLAILLGSKIVSAETLVGDSSNGESLFSHHCGACHSLTTNRVGPVLEGVFGRKAGTIGGFNYSKAVQSSNVIWNTDTLDQWLSGPQKLIPGQKMNFNISDPQKRADIIAYLKTVSQPGSGK